MCIRDRGNSKEFTEKVISLYNNIDKINTFPIDKFSARVSLLI